ncbi:hypothetical protein P872_16580 [Rhodonellum psychrophilum GCM71 = DSM 17998]|uniref:Isomerase n=2 Tax=Rhodonellum TaxID=336827 RepID=U5C0F3_9BACT|nr:MULTISPECIES: PhzF family phenazine biosynthesis protein [Rhodonellum]ERM83294.1 hypothetical protein P872_16580 [Rhodonellum psychrophilum GCM71 = DSM 17998]SDZ50219.1 phenazine biosynthesis protein PhzF family [Rhodonellum ikkaensis]
MNLKIYQVDAFASKVFGGNPAAVVPLSSWLEDKCLQQIAMENNLSETAFYVREGKHFTLRWFTPTVEVDLCGHATLAAAHVLFQHEGFQGDEIEFMSPRSGPLHVRKKNDVLQLDFPADDFSEVVLVESLHMGFQPKPIAAFKGKTDYLLLFENESQIQNLKFDIPSIAKVKARGIIVTAPGNEVDFVSRFFGPQVGVDEDPVTGSAHTTLTPFWSEKLGKNALTAIQMSPRKGELTCELAGKRVLISGKAVTYLIGEIFI